MLAYEHRLGMSHEHEAISSSHVRNLIFVTFLMFTSWASQLIADNSVCTSGIFTLGCGGKYPAVKTPFTSSLITKGYRTLVTSVNDPKWVHCFDLRCQADNPYFLKCIIYHVWCARQAVDQALTQWEKKLAKYQSKHWGNFDLWSRGIWLISI